jgi:hypothetical protein
MRENTVMAMNDIDTMPAIADLADFDRNSGSRFERLIFNHRLLVVIACVLATCCSAGRRPG